MTALLFDTETTGITRPGLLEAAWCRVDTIQHLMSRSEATMWMDIQCRRFNPGVPIEYGAMATHHITADTVADCPSPMGFRLPDAEYLIGHNVDFDWQVIQQYGPQPKVKRICTLALSRSLWPVMDSHKQTAVLYRLDQPIAQQLAPLAHNAESDIAILCYILRHIVQATGVSSWETLWERSEAARIPTLMPFGKHKGERINDVPVDYRQWLLRQPDVDPYLAQALRGMGQTGSLL